MSAAVTSESCNQERDKIYNRLWWVAALVIGMPVAVFIWHGSKFVDREIFELRMIQVQQDVQEQTESIKSLRCEINSLRQDLMKSRRETPSIYRTGVNYADKPQRQESP